MSRRVLPTKAVADPVVIHPLQYSYYGATRAYFGCVDHDVIGGKQENGPS